MSSCNDAARASAPDFLAGGGEIGALVRAYDWSATPLDAPDTWPQSLRSSLSICLNSSTPSAIYWGPDFRLLYNDAYSKILVDRHPRALGQKFEDVWPEAWPVLGPQLAKVVCTGHGFAADRFQLMLRRQGELQETYWFYSFAPIRGEGGAVLGVFVHGREITASVRAERQQTCRLSLEARLGDATDPAEAIAAASEALGRYLSVGQVTYGEVEPDGETVLIEREWNDGTISSGASRYRLDVYGPGYTNELKQGERIAVTDVHLDPRTYSAEALVSLARASIRSFLIVPLVKAGRLAAVLAIHSSTHRIWSPEEVAFAGEIAERTWEAAARARAEASLRNAEERYLALFNGIDQGFCTIEVAFDEHDVPFDYRFIEVSPSFERQTGIENGADRWMREIAPDQDRFWFDTYGRVALTGHPARFENYSTPLDRWWDVYAFRISGLHRVAVLFRDITDKKRAEVSLRELNDNLEQRVADALAERRVFAQVIENTKAAVLACKLDFGILAINAANASEMERVFGVRPAVGDNLLDVLSAMPEHRAQVELHWGRALAGEEFTIIDEFGDPGRERVHYEVRFAPLHSRSGERIGAFQTAHDITDRVRAQTELAAAQEALRQSQKMESLGQLTGGVAHDFNNLLTVIRSSVDLLKRPNLAEERRDRYIAAIADTVERAAKVTGQLLAFARRQALQPRIFAACDSVRMLSEMLATLTGSRVEVVTDLPEHRCFVNADPSQFDTVLVNMAVNARDAMNGEGRLTIKVRSVQQLPTTQLHATVPGPYVAVSLTDTGSGIPPDQLDRIFEPFFTTKDQGKGTGLGLSQVIGFAKQSGGEVTVETRVGKGTTFTIFLPQVAEEEQPIEAEEVQPLMDGHGIRVLVVEDNAAVGNLAMQNLAELGYEAVLAANAQEALAELAKSADRFDVVFSDVVMPGLSGIKLGRRIQQDHRDLPVVLTSGYSHVLAENGTYGFELLHKPYSVEQFSRVLHKAANGRQRLHLGDT